MARGAIFPSDTAPKAPAAAPKAQEAPKKAPDPAPEPKKPLQAAQEGQNERPPAEMGDQSFSETIEEAETEAHAEEKGPNDGETTPEAQPAASGGGEKPSQEPEYEIKVDGEVQKKPLREILTLAEKASGADRRFEEASQIRNAAKEVFGLLQPDKSPEDALADLWTGFYKGDKSRAAQSFVDMSGRALGRLIDNEKYYPEILKVVNTLIDKALKLEEMHPAERKAQTLERELQAERARVKAAEEAESKRQEEAATIEQADVVAGEITSALKNLQIPEDEDTVKAVARTWLLLRQSEPDADAKMAVEDWLKYRPQGEERRKLVEDHWKEIEGLAEDKVLEKIPQGAIDKILKATLAKTKADRRPTPNRNGAPPEEKPERPRRVPSHRLFG